MKILRVKFHNSIRVDNKEVTHIDSERDRVSIKADLPNQILRVDSTKGTVIIPLTNCAYLQEAIVEQPAQAPKAIKRTQSKTKGPRLTTTTP